MQFAAALFYKPGGCSHLIRREPQYNLRGNLEGEAERVTRLPCRFQRPTYFAPKGIGRQEVGRRFAFMCARIEHSLCRMTYFGNEIELEVSTQD